MSEKNVMMQLNHPFLVRLFQTYKDRDKLYFLLEPMLGGELFTLLRNQTLFDENTSRFYASCVVSAFEYMHDLDIIYRDLKPENLLFDDMGYVKIADFGFAKKVTGSLLSPRLPQSSLLGRTWTLCGTPDYLAPEIVAGKGHDKGVDWWTLGILIYEMLASYPPFYDEEHMKTYAKIINGEVLYPSHFSKAAISLIRKLLNRKATKRLGFGRGGTSRLLWSLANSLCRSPRGAQARLVRTHRLREVVPQADRGAHDPHDQEQHISRQLPGRGGRGGGSCAALPRRRIRETLGR